MGMGASSPRSARPASTSTRTTREYPAGWEPSGADFLSLALTEAELMARSSADGVADWLDRFLPDASRETRQEPVTSSPTTTTARSRISTAST